MQWTRVVKHINSKTVATLAAGVFLSVLGAWWQSAVNQQQIEQALEEASGELAAAIDARLERYQYGLRGARGVVLAVGADHLSRELFQGYVNSRNIQSEFPGARGFGFIRRVPPAQESDFLQRVRALGWPDFAIHQITQQDGERFVIQYIEPVTRNMPAVGLDIASEANRRNAALAAAHSGEARLTGPITLVQATEIPQQAFLMLLPVYRTWAAPATPDARMTEALGWTYTPLIIGEVLAGLVDPNRAQFNLSDIGEPAAQSHKAPFFSSGQSTPTGTMPTTSRSWQLLGRTWQLQYSATPVFIHQLHLTEPGLVLIAGCLLSALAVILLGIAGTYSSRRQQVARAQSWLSTLVENSDDAIVGMSLDGSVISWNPGAERLFGFSSEEIQGRLLRELLVPTELQAEDIAFLNNIAQGRRVQSFETQRRHKDGQLLEISATVSPIYNAKGQVIGVSKTLRDISQQKALRTRLQQMNDELEREVAEQTQVIAASLETTRGILETAKTPIITIDANGIIHSCNSATEKAFGYGREEMIGSNISMLMPERFASAHHGYMERFRLTGGGRALEINREIEAQRKDGSTFPLQISLGAMNLGGAQMVVGILTDLTEQHQQRDALALAKAQADAANAAKSSFLANMSHEIRTPMNAVLGMLQLTRQTELSARQRDYLSKAHSAATSLLGLLNDILDYSKIEAGKLQLDIHPFAFEALMQDLGVVLSGNQGQKEVEVIFDIDSTLPATVVGDRLRLQQVLINLAGNALKFTERGQVVIGAHQLERGAQSVRLRISVSDSGIGIHEEQLARIFDSFTQAESSTTRRFGGTGLGLYISRYLVELMGGQLQVQSTPAVGSRFWFELELAVNEQAVLAQPLAASYPALRVLIVDDNPIGGEILVQTLATQGWSAEWVDGGLRAVGKVMAAAESGTPYDLVLMDWRMPEVDGVAAAKLIQSLRGNHDAPVIVMITAYDRETLENLQGSEEVPFATTLTKPITPQQLADAIRQVLSNDSEAGQANRVPANAPRLTGLNILVVEDNALNRQIADELLSGEGAVVSLAENGQEGEEAVVNNGQHLDLVLMDMLMPVVDGLEATRRIRAREAFQALPIIAMTANASAADKQACLAAGMNAHVAKPIDLDNLVATILAHLGKAAEPPPPSIKVLDASAPLVDREDVLKRYSYKMDLIQRLLHSYAEGMDAMLAELREQVSCVDSQAVERSLHSLKGMAAGMGAIRLATLAQTLEHALRLAEAGEHQKIIEQLNLEQLGALVAETTKALHAAFGTENSSL